MKNMSQRWNMETKPWQIPYPMENWKSYTVYNCPNTEKYRVNKIHIGLGCLARYEFYWPDIFRVTNLSWFCNQTSYLMFPILGQWIYHNFESIFHLWLIFFILSQRCKGDNSNWLNKILHWNLLEQYQPIILRDLT
jgi:hypothetical protein